MPQRTYHAGIDRTAVLSAALAALDEDGIDSLTMRAIGRRLGVEAPSLYVHVTGKEDLLDGVLNHVLDGIPDFADGVPWRQALVGGFTAYRATLLAHPAVVPLLVRRARLSASQARLVTQSVGCLRAAGLSLDDAVQGHITLASFVVGFLTQEVAPFPRTPAAVRIDPDFGPIIEASRRNPVDERFRLGLESIITGLVGP